MKNTKTDFASRGGEPAGKLGRTAKDADHAPGRLSWLWEACLDIQGILQCVCVYFCECIHMSAHSYIYIYVDMCI